MIHDEIINLLKKYSFVTDVYRKGLSIYIWFDIEENVSTCKKISIFCNKPKLQKCIREIKKLSYVKRENGKQELPIGTT